MSEIIFFICSMLAISALFAAPKVTAWLAALRWQEEFRNKRKKKGLCPSSCRQGPLPLQVRLHQKVRGRLELRGDLVAEWILQQAHSTQLQRLKWKQRMHTLAGWKRREAAETCRMREEDSGETVNAESEPWYYRPAPQNNEACGKPLAGGSAEFVSSEFQKSQCNIGATRKHFLAISPDHVPYMNDVYNMVRKVHIRPADDPMKDLGVNMAIWRIFMNATLRAAIHLGNDHYVNLRNVQNSSWRIAGQLFGDIEKLISGQTETSGINLIDSQDLRWISTSLLHSRAHQYATAKVYVFSDLVLCLGETIPINHGRTRVSGIQRPTSSANWIELMESWRNSSGRFSQDSRQRLSSKKFRIRWANNSVTQRISKTGSSSCQCSTTLNGKQEEMKYYAKNNSKRVAEYARQFLRGHWSFLEPGSDKKWCGTYDGIPSGYLVNFEKSGHLIFRCTSALEQGQLRSKEGGKTTFHFTVWGECTVASENGYVRQSAQSLRSSSGYDSRITRRNKKFLFNFLLQTYHQGNLLQDYEQRFERLPEDQKLSKLCSEAGLNLVELGQFFHALPSPKEPKTHYFEKTKRNIVQKGGSEATNDSALSWR